MPANMFVSFTDESRPTAAALLPSGAVVLVGEPKECTDNPPELPSPRLKLMLLLAVVVALITAVVVLGLGLLSILVKLLPSCHIPWGALDADTLLPPLPPRTPSSILTHGPSPPPV